MSRSEREKMADRLNAGQGDAKLGVHCLSEFVYCPRAGLCLHEQDQEYVDPADTPNLGYLPIYERAELERSLKAILDQFWGILAAGTLAVSACGLMAWLTGWAILGWLACGVGGVTIWALVNRGRWALVTYGYLQLWQGAEAKLPDPDSTAIEEIHWCELRAAGFTLDAPSAMYAQKEWNFGGKPWRILRLADLRIPVFLHRTDWKGVHDQHIVRMAAYCRLVEAEEGFRSPYGIIVQARSYRAWVFPNTARSQKMFVEALLEARRIVRASEEVDGRPLVPAGGAFCRPCPAGKPKAYSRGKKFLRHKREIDVSPAFTRGRTAFHSHCGDRFRWVPPHDGLPAWHPARWRPS